MSLRGRRRAIECDDASSGQEYNGEKKTIARSRVKYGRSISPSVVVHARKEAGTKLCCTIPDEGEGPAFGWGQAASLRSGTSTTTRGKEDERDVGWNIQIHTWERLVTDIYIEYHVKKSENTVAAELNVQT